MIGVFLAVAKGANWILAGLGLSQLGDAYDSLFGEEASAQAKILTVTNVVMMGFLIWTIKSDPYRSRNWKRR